MMARNEGLQPIRSALDEMGRRLGLSGAVTTGVLWNKWVEVVGPAIASHAEPTSLKAGVLRVRVDSPTWATEIGYLGGEIVRKANALMGQELVNEIKVWSAPGEFGAGSRARRHAAATEQATNATPPPDDPTKALESAYEAWQRRRSGRRG